MERLRQIEINPLAVILLLLAAAAVVLYFVWVKPSSEEAAIAKNWNTPEAAAKRGPGREVSSTYQATVQQLLAKERKQMPTRRDRD